MLTTYTIAECGAPNEGLFGEPGIEPGDSRWQRLMLPLHHSPQRGKRAHLADTGVRTRGPLYPKQGSYL